MTQTNSEKDKALNEKIELFRKLWELSDDLRVNNSEILNAAKTVNLINSYTDKTIQLFYEAIRLKALKEGTDPQETVFFQIYEELEINNNVQARYALDIIEQAQKLQKKLELLEEIANEI